MRFLRQITGSFSSPAAGNPTVALVEAAYRHHGIEAVYVNCEVPADDLAAAVRGARAMGWAGFNASLPHKVAVLQHLDSVATSAEVIGAVNCVVRDGERLVGHNTDGQGFLASLRSVVDPAGRDVVVLGAGGAARAVAVEVALAGARAVTVVNRSREKGQALVDLLTERTPAPASYAGWSGTWAVPAGTDVLVNATSIGFGPQAQDDCPDVDLAALAPGAVVADVVPATRPTALLLAAEAHGATTLGGAGMLVNQAVLGIRLWTGVVVDPAVLMAALAEVSVT